MTKDQRLLIVKKSGRPYSGKEQIERAFLILKQLEDQGIQEPPKTILRPFERVRKLEPAATTRNRAKLKVN